jgi:hypothetical protein
VVIGKEGLEALVGVLAERGRTVIGPTACDGAIVLAELTSAEQLPYGWGAELEAGYYRIRAREDGMAFAHSAGPVSCTPRISSAPTAPSTSPAPIAPRSNGGCG